MTIDGIDFPHWIEITRLRNGRWKYIIRLTEEKSRPSLPFPTRQKALDDARQLLSYML